MILVKISSPFSHSTTAQIPVTLHRYLKQLGAPIDTITPILPDIKPSEGLFIVDTASLFGALEGEGRNTRGLQQVCNHLKIETQFLHNAGNDAYVSTSRIHSSAFFYSLPTVHFTRAGGNGLGATVRHATGGKVAKPYRGAGQYRWR